MNNYKNGCYQKKNSFWNTKNVSTKSVSVVPGVRRVETK